MRHYLGLEGKSINLLLADPSSNGSDCNFVVIDDRARVKISCRDVPNIGLLFTIELNWQQKQVAVNETFKIKFFCNYLKCIC